jgi:hypothetical protein
VWVMDRGMVSEENLSSEVDPLRWTVFGST